MRKIILILLIPFTTCLFNSCENNQDDLIILPGPYLGVLQTSENDPTPIGGDSDGDWFDLPNVGFSVSGAYPNPTSDQITIVFQTNTQQNVKIYLHHPITKQTKLVFDQEAQAGMYSLRISLKNLNIAKGFIRCYFNVKSLITFGDIFYE